MVRFLRPVGALFIAASSLLAAPVFAQDSGALEDTADVAPASDLGGAQTRNFSLDGRTRSYLVQPVAGGGTHPIVILLHGSFQTAETAWQRSGLPALARTKNFIMVSGQGYKKRWNDGRSFKDSDYAKADNGVDDVAYLRAVINDVAARDGGNPDQVFMLGTSSGGFMTMRFACEAGERLRAAAAINATLPVSLSHACRPARALPWLFMNGTRDYIVPFTGRARPAWMSASASFDYFADRDGCSTSALVVPAAAARREGTWVEKHARAGCASGASSTQYIVHNGGHTWPSASAWRRGDQDVTSATAVWKHFEATLYGR